MRLDSVGGNFLVDAELQDDGADGCVMRYFAGDSDGSVRGTSAAAYCFFGGVFGTICIYLNSFAAPPPSCDVLYLVHMRIGR